MSEYILTNEECELIIEKTVDFIENNMIETSPNSFELKDPQEKTMQYIRNEIEQKLQEKFPEIKTKTQVMKSIIEQNIDKIEKMM